MHIDFELVIAAIFFAGGVTLQWKARRTDTTQTLILGLTDMQFLGLLMWIAGLVLFMDCRWHFLTEADQ